MVMVKWVKESETNRRDEKPVFGGAEGERVDLRLVRGGGIFVANE